MGCWHEQRGDKSIISFLVRKQFLVRITRTASINSIKQVIIAPAIPMPIASHEGPTDCTKMFCNILGPINFIALRRSTMPKTSAPKANVPVTKIAASIISHFAIGEIRLLLPA